MDEFWMLWGWFSHVLGLDNLSGPFYGFWSGFGSDITELAILGGLVSVYLRHNCHVKRCWRIGRERVEGTTLVVCRKHHPHDAPEAHEIGGLHEEATGGRLVPDPASDETRIDRSRGPGAAGGVVQAQNVRAGGAPTVISELPFAPMVEAPDSIDHLTLPTRAHPDDAGLDLYVTEDAIVRPGQFVDIHCRLGMELPSNLWALVIGRSSTLRKRGLIVNPGIIDTGYRGELFTGVWNAGEKPVEVKTGERLAQIILFHNLTQHYVPVLVEALSQSSRGEQGFGSSGQ